MPKPKSVIQDAPWLKLTYTILGLAMQVHNELGPGHREAVYHDAMAAKLKQAGLNFEDEPYIPVTLEREPSSAATALIMWLSKLSSLNTKPAHT